MSAAAPRFSTGDKVRLIGSPGFIGTVVRYYAPMRSGAVNVGVYWDRHGDNGHLYSVLESQLESAR
jgi:hypothetical protein